MSKRILAMMLVLFVAFGSLPTPVMTYAEMSQDSGESGNTGGENSGDNTEEQTGNNQAVTVTIPEASESETEVVPISGATVEYTISEELPNEETAVWTTVEGSTASDGTVTVLTENQEIVTTDTTTTTETTTEETVEADVKSEGVMTYEEYLHLDIKQIQ